MIRKSKNYARPQKLYNKPRILEENDLVETYGLKNKKEIWKTDSKVKYFRNRAKILITAGSEDQETFFKKLNKMGLKVKSVSDVLALEKEDLLRRRLSTIVWSKGLANTAKQARQMIVHKQILIGDSVVNVPGYIVEVFEESLISVKVKKVKSKKKFTESEKETKKIEESSDGIKNRVEEKQDA